MIPSHAVIYSLHLHTPFRQSCTIEEYPPTVVGHPKVNPHRLPISYTGERHFCRWRHRTDFQKGWPAPDYHFYYFRRCTRRTRGRQRTGAGLLYSPALVKCQSLSFISAFKQTADNYRRDLDATLLSGKVRSDCVPGYSCSSNEQTVIRRHGSLSGSW